jgi:SAM-dependent methyltransferase
MPPVDFARAAADYAEFRPPFDPRVFDRLAEFGVGVPGQLVLDVGAGTGLLGVGLVARGARVVESDLSLALLRRAQSPARVAARAEALPFADAAFDAVTAGQCWHWFDRRVAPRELRRVLKPGGAIAVVYQTYLPLPGNVADASERLILKFRPRWRHAGGVGVNGQALKDLQVGGFGGVESFTFDVEIPYGRDAWRGFVRTCSAVAPTLSPAELAAFDVEHAEALERFADAFAVPHRVFVAVARGA